MRFAILEAKLALASIVRNYILSPSSKTVEPYTIDPKAGIPYAIDGLYVEVEKIQWRYIFETRMNRNLLLFQLISK